MWQEIDVPAERLEAFQENRPFSGVKISLCGQLSERKSWFRISVVRLGGTFSPMIDESTTHLIVPLIVDPENPRIEFAVKHSIPVVEESWFFESIKKGQAQGALQYLHIEPEKKEEKGEKKPKKTAQLLDEDDDFLADEDRSTVVITKMQNYFWSLCNQLREDKASNDIFFLVGPQKSVFGAHSVVIKTKSPSLYDLIQTKKTKYQGHLALELEDCSPEVFAPILEVCFKNKLSSQAYLYRNCHLQY
jgi:hypothetical protein